MESHNTILRLPQVITKTGISRSSIYDWMQKGTFPKAIKLGCRSVGWIEQEIDDWIAKHMKNR
ncbi:MAG: AlpA family transcriptional regulator [Micavibrio aeruginosavorus]|uniref:AlpA family transcriptional regulator n=1 Tax=Micavibrio aeruginosavorus TaxID=349221 RepID=A0A7T5R3B4_9BACT|nr:MAG: AlpA family transcriptional regulator [Micavibrio aeruginosavorus]